LILQKENIQENIRETEMKKSTLLVWMHVFLIVVVIASVWLIAGNDVEKAAVEKPYVLSMTASVDIPDEMTFAGEKIVFDRYDLRERMDRELNSFTYFHSTTLLLFKRANRIFPIIEPILKREGIPDDMKYLAVIESSLDHRATSPARAVGLWQFIAIRPGLTDWKFLPKWTSGIISKNRPRRLVAI
jgi:membrane-bound lytic murein transglycosylase D